MEAPKQDEHIQQLNNSLAAAFTAKAAVIPDDRLRELMERWNARGAAARRADVEIDESMVLDLSGPPELGAGGRARGRLRCPRRPMVAWARELQVGSWYMLEYRAGNEPVQLAWHGMRKQLSLFVTPQGRCMLFQQHRLASYLQAGPAAAGAGRGADGARHALALAKLDVDSSRRLPDRLGSACNQAAGQEPAGPGVSGSVALRGDEQLVEDQRVGLLAQAPEDHQHDDLQVFQVQRAAAHGRRAVDDHLAHGGGRTPADSRKADETDRVLAQQFHLGGGVDAQAALALRRHVGLRAVARPSSQRSASWISSLSKPTADSLRVSCRGSGQASGRQ
jgi:hypothetical protein